MLPSLSRPAANAGLFLFGMNQEETIPSLAKRTVAEGVGSAMLLIAVVGSGIMENAWLAETKRSLFLPTP